MTAERENLSLQRMSPLSGYQANSKTRSALKSHTHKQQEQTPQVLSALVGMDLSSSFWSCAPLFLFIVFHVIHSGELSLMWFPL